MKFKDLKSFTQSAHYKVSVNWNDLEERLNHDMNVRELVKLDINPKFQRGHVWTRKQQIAYIEFKLKGGEGSNIIYFNCKGWMRNFEGPFVLVDGKQRIEAVRAFLKNEFQIFETYYFSDFDGQIPSEINFIFAINNLNNESDVLKWYLEMNSGGTPHTQEELNKVKDMINESKN